MKQIHITEKRIGIHFPQQLYEKLLSRCNSQGQQIAPYIRALIIKDLQGGTS